MKKYFWKVTFEWRFYARHRIGNVWHMDVSNDDQRFGRRIGGKRNSLL